MGREKIGCWASRMGTVMERHRERSRYSLGARAGKPMALCRRERGILIAEAIWKDFWIPRWNVPLRAS